MERSSSGGKCRKSKSKSAPRVNRYKATNSNFDDSKAVVGSTDVAPIVPIRRQSVSFQGDAPNTKGNDNNNNKNTNNTNNRKNGTNSSNNRSNRNDDEERFRKNQNKSTFGPPKLPAKPPQSHPSTPNSENANMPKTNVYGKMTKKQRDILMAAVATAVGDDIKLSGYNPELQTFRNQEMTCCHEQEDDCDNDEASPVHEQQQQQREQQAPMDLKDFQTPNTVSPCPFDFQNNTKRKTNSMSSRSQNTNKTWSHTSTEDDDMLMDDGECLSSDRNGALETDSTGNYRLDYSERSTHEDELTAVSEITATTEWGDNDHDKKSLHDSIEESCYEDSYMSPSNNTTRMTISVDGFTGPALTAPKSLLVSPSLPCLCSSSSSTPTTVTIEATADHDSHKVRFEHVHVRYYERVLEINPACSTGPPVGLGWIVMEEETDIPIDDFEHERYCIRGENPRDFRLSREERELLLRSCGYKGRSIADAIRSVRRAKNERRQTVVNLHASSVEEAIEKASRRVKKVLRFRGIRKTIVRT